MSTETALRSTLVPTGVASALLPHPDLRLSPVRVVGTEAIRATFDEVCLQQALNTRGAPGVAEVVLNPDAHRGFGAPIGCVLASPSHIYPGPVGVDIKCSMSLLQLDVPAAAIADRATRRALIGAIVERIPTGAGRGQTSARKSRRIARATALAAILEGATAAVCGDMGIPAAWAERCEDAYHGGHDGTAQALGARLEVLRASGVLDKLDAKLAQLGSYGGGNHFGECEVVRIAGDARAHRVAEVFGLRDGHAAFLSHCGSRGLGHNLATAQFRDLREHFARHGIALPAGDRDLVHAPLGTPEADAYLDDMALGANFATLNHLLINALVLEAFQEILPGARGELVYFISHNIARREDVGGEAMWVHRKGATRAFPAGHPALESTPFAAVGHPILLPGNPRDGSVVMVADAGAAAACFSVNHGAGRALGRKAAMRTLDQDTVERSLAERDILSNCRVYPRDEAPAAYKNFEDVLDSVKGAGLASEVARLDARFVIKDGAPADD